MECKGQPVCYLSHAGGKQLSQMGARFAKRFPALVRSQYFSQNYPATATIVSVWGFLADEVTRDMSHIQHDG